MFYDSIAYIYNQLVPGKARKVGCIVKNRLWSRQEILLCIDLYCRLPYRKLRQTTPEVRELAELLGRTPSAISMRACNYASLDPIESKRVKGLVHLAKSDISVWNEIHSDWQKFTLEIDQLKRMMINNAITANNKVYCETKNQDLNISIHFGGDKEQMVCARIGQQFFRDAVLTAYGHRCCITGLHHDTLLVTSHIKPWKYSDPKTERTNPRNGLCLSPLYDKAFDAGLMTLDDQYRVVFSPAIKDCASKQVAQRFFHNYGGKKINLPVRFWPESLFLEYHRTNIFNH